MNCLNEDISYEEVEGLLMDFPRFKAADAEGLTCELLRAVVRNDYADNKERDEAAATMPGCASQKLVECLVHIMQHLHECDEYPSQVATGKLTPIPKKNGSPTDKSSYRGICVSSVFSKLQDSLLTKRGEPRIEELELRAPTQCGFRRHHGTIDALFVTNHLINKCMHQKQCLYTCYVDFKQAFDMARRMDGMVVRAEQLGIHGPFLAALRKSMDNAYLSVYVNGCVGDRFRTYRGTKQGGELSPLLFGLFIEQLHELIAMKLPGAGPLIGDMRVPEIMYADDVKLLAVNDPKALQQLLDVLHLFCRLFDMEVNLKPHKTCIVIFRPSGTRLAKGLKWYYNGQEVHVSDNYVDLGALHHATKGIRPACDALASSGSRAMHALLSQCRQHHIVQPDFKLRLFDILVEPVLSYGCQVWGPEIFAGKLRNPLNLPSEKVHTNYLRIMAGVGNGADKVMLMREFGRYPVMWHWVALATRFWIRAIKMGSHKLVCKALRADIELMLAGCKKCWSYYLLQSLTIVGVVQASDWSPSGTSHVTVDSIMALDIQEKVVRESLKQMFDKCWEDVDLVCEHPQDPACPRNRIIHNSYAAWARGLHDDAPTYLKSKTLSFRMVQCIAKMRLGWHCLAIHTRRYNGIVRDDRVCRLCQKLGYRDDTTGSIPVEDLVHFMLDCRVLHPVRDDFPLFFKPASLPGQSKDSHVKFILNHSDHVQVVRCISALKKRRESCLQLLDDGREGEIMPEGYLPFDYNLWRIMGHDID